MRGLKTLVKKNHTKPYIKKNDTDGAVADDEGRLSAGSNMHVVICR
jgi:hypothetical protein